MKSSVVWVVMLCSLLKFSRNFAGIYRLHLQFRKRLLSSSCWFVIWLILRSWRWGLHILAKRPLALNGLLGVISKKKEILMNNINFKKVVPVTGRGGP
jgi:hypothetical protein